MNGHTVYMFTCSVFHLYLYKDFDLSPLSIHERWVFQIHVGFQVVSEMLLQRLQVQAHVVSLLGKVGAEIV